MPLFCHIYRINEVTSFIRNLTKQRHTTVCFVHIGIVYNFVYKQSYLQKLNYGKILTFKCIKHRFQRMYLSVGFRIPFNVYIISSK